MPVTQRGAPKTPSAEDAKARDKAAKKAAKDHDSDDEHPDDAAEAEGSSPAGPSEPLLFGMFPVPRKVVNIGMWVLRIYLLWQIAQLAFSIRNYAIEEYGRLIHEFDPWFNMRATRYLRDKGWYEFFHWFDYMSWYPLGRPIGTTIYPGMQITSVAIWKVLKALGKPYSMVLKDVCVFVPSWFGVLATMLTGLLTWEASGSADSAVAASAIMSIIPAHTMRSIGGGYDNESVAVSALVLTFYFWVRSLRNSHSWIWGVGTGVAMGYMAAVWGGYVFVINMVAAHCLFLIITGKFDLNMWKAYSLFWAIGVAIATRVPVIGLAPVKSLEQCVPLFTFIGVQVLAYLKHEKDSKNMDSDQFKALRNRTIGLVACAVVAAWFVLYQIGFLGPLSSRVRALFVQHTRTGNPLVDSVAEHQPGSPQAYWQHMHYAYFLAPIGAVLSLATTSKWNQASFLFLYGAVTYYFTDKMVRLLILAGPAASALSGVTIGYLIEWAVNNLWTDPAGDAAAAGPPGKKDKKKTGKGKPTPLEEAQASWNVHYTSPTGKIARRFGAIFVVVLGPFLAAPYVRDFASHCDQFAHAFSSPQIVTKARTHDGQVVKIEDYVDSYKWLKENTPEESRVMSWWDYGYQITGIANRTTIADGNTWNHEHIATLGWCLTSPVKEAHRVIRHIADYVLVWAGGGGDDIAKSPHMARIGNSVYDTICPNDPTCTRFRFTQEGPTKMMRDSLLYNLIFDKERPDADIDENRFELVYTSKYRKVKIFKVKAVSEESKAWLADPNNRICDAPGSWYCVGQYPPAMQDLIASRADFEQVEDMNRKKSDKARKYQEEYHKRMAQGG